MNCRCLFYPAAFALPELFNQKRTAAILKPAYFSSRLEALRGVAAVMVAVWHTFAICPGSGLQAVAIEWIRRFSNGNAAVTLFFVLSGYVLGLSLRKSSESSAKQVLGFGVRRLFRIYPAFLFATLLVVGCLYYSHYVEGLFPPWFNSAGDYRAPELNPGRPPTLGVLIANLVLWDPSINYVTWTLGIELRCSLLLPLLYWWSRHLSIRGRGMLLLALIFSACLGKWCLLLGSARAEAVVALVVSGFTGFLFLFYLGYLLPEIGPILFEKLRRSPVAAFFLPWVAAIVWLCADSWGDEFRVLQGAGATLLIGSLLYGAEGRVWRMLDYPLAKFYGRISFSFYLWHDLVLVVCARTLAHLASLAVRSNDSILCGAVLLLGSVLLATGVASLSARFIERPFIGYGKDLTAKLFGRAAEIGPNPQILPAPEQASPLFEAPPADRAA